MAALRRNVLQGAFIDNLRSQQFDGRQRLSAHWIPTAKGANPDPVHDDVHTLLLKTGFLQQAYSGVFQMLPLGLRVQQKLEALVDKHMQSIGASKLSLSSLTTEALWTKSGRLQGDSSELLRLKSRAKDAFLLSPTHEEEITAVAAETVHSPKDLPLRLYQVSRKYRDERRPRQGLLRAREFLMKDLYTFDIDESTALHTYAQVKAAYNAFFDDLKFPYLVADADSGAMGGNLSHEFHYQMPEGEDTIFKCNKCPYTANEELAEARREPASAATNESIKSWIGLTSNGRGLVVVFYEGSRTARSTGGGSKDDINPHALKVLVPSLDTSHEDALASWIANITAAEPSSGLDFSVQTITDVHCPTGAAALSPEVLFHELIVGRVGAINMTRDDQKRLPVTVTSKRHSATIDLLRVAEGDTCPRCNSGKLSALNAVELGHTFHLGTRYSEPLGATVRASTAQQRIPLVMGCHGIGVSRMIAAVSGALRDTRGLNWPSVIAPFQVIIITGAKATDEHAQDVYDTLCLSEHSSLDVVIDDRQGSMIQRLKDADLVGYPVVIVLGKAWAQEQKCEVQCRRESFQQNVALPDLLGTVSALIAQL